MVKRAPKKAKKKTVKSKVKKAPRKKAPLKKKKAAAKETSAATKNREAQWKVYHALRARADAAIAKLTADVRRKAPMDVLVKDRNELLLILGECHYMANECARLSKTSD